MLTKQQTIDRDISTFIWYTLRDYGDIQIGEDDRWAELVNKCNTAGRRFPEARRTFTECVLGMLEDRARKYRLED